MSDASSPLRADRSDPPLRGELQCPKEFYHFCLERFSRIEADVRALKDLVTSRIATDDGERRAHETTLKRLAWLVTTLIAALATFAAFR